MFSCFLLMFFFYVFTFVDAACVLTTMVTVTAT